ncbi:MAG TPA: SpoIVB peptidase [Bacillota bacterium]|jgi:stage IV sporulation protein B|nr:SpoIVB peptidase [Bacillota bacterium]HQC81907.1 SpoIVB peptidase [Bacillota bacterium]
MTERNITRLRLFSVLLLIVSLILFTGTGLLFNSIPDQIKIFADETKIINLPLKEVTIKVLPETKVIPGGQPVGVRMDVKGVLVVGLEEIQTVDGDKVNPGLEAGLEIGDSILAINNEPVDSPEEVKTVVNKQKGKVRLKVRRQGDILYIRISPVQAAEDGLYKIGVWVRDKTAGLGTLTFYDPYTKSFGALGHAITDPDTGHVLPVERGELLSASVESVKQGTAGIPGEIRGIFYEADEPLGDLNLNTEYGIFGSFYKEFTNPFYSEPLPIGYQNQVEEGPAWILATVDGNKIERYEICIDKVNHQTKPGTKSMVITVTDPRLLKKTGGIVQGMSGSPIIQNDKIIGAITHVFVNDPLKGYGIFIEWMLQQTDQLSNIS